MIDRTLLLLLAALALVFFAWRAARRQTQRALAAREAAIERATKTLEPVESPHSRGFVVVLSTGETSDEWELTWDDDGVMLLPLDGFPATPEAADSAAFTPGMNVELVVDSDDPLVIEAWDPAMTLRAGRVPAEHARAVLQRIDAVEVGECVVLREYLEQGRRTGLELLLVHRDSPLES